MAQWLKQSTTITLRFGPFLDETDGKTAETGLTIAQADVRLSKANGVFAQKTDATSATHEENGWYQIPLDATDTGTVGPLIVAVHVSGALPVWQQYVVTAANIYDSLIAASDKLDINVNEWLGSGAPANTGDAFARLGAPVAASISADIANVQTDTDAIEVDTQDIQTRLPAALSSGNMKVDVLAISGTTTAADRLEESTQGIVTGTVGAASTTTSIVTSALDPSAAVTDQYKGRIVTFLQGTTTGNLAGQSTDITASTSGGVLTVTALTDAPVSGDTFVIT